MDELVVSRVGAVLTILLNRPERLNALNTVMHTELLAALARAEEDDAVRAIVITGAGRGFCAGLDLSDSAAIDWSTQSRHHRYEQYGWVGHMALAIADHDKPILAAMNGIAAGAGLALALACDLRFLAESARVTTGYIRRGLSPDAGLTYFLPRLIGQTRATELVLTGRDVAAEEAERIGLVTGVVPDRELREKVAQVAAALAAGPPVATTFSKRLLRSSQDLTLEETLKREFASIKLCFQTRDVTEGIAAFAEKRAPEFRGE